ncbi:MAG: death-on-curing family protein [Candidatus Kaiserbacteria bacterium GW2011_GWC2_49_12]|uniref:Death-on-curing family protein n=1 Tax=Candidatus Kaiserbacteria bacterium GW2011_GWC2_49_12 TaxID=1618675 RepID=A0A0G1VLW8_9BACT|nr:MAG: death-on-curing family protein [Candidatus Kaiserbacteria bacterium GW2011_GWC2_49_12]
MYYLSAADILAVHDRVIEETGGSLGLRDTHLLLSIAERPKTSFGGTEQFPDVFTKAAVYLESISMYHVFIDGNKRTALTVAGAESEKFMLAAAQHQKTLKDIAEWLKKRTRRIRKKN